MKLVLNLTELQAKAIWQALLIAKDSYLQECDCNETMPPYAVQRLRVLRNAMVKWQEACQLSRRRDTA